MFRCPYCSAEAPPVISKGGLNSNGWVIFILALLFCLPLCFLPFLLDSCKEDVRKCSSCGAKVG